MQNSANFSSSSLQSLQQTQIECAIDNASSDVADKCTQFCPQTEGHLPFPPENQIAIATVYHSCESVQTTDFNESWIAPVIPRFSSKTFGGPFGRSEHAVLERLSRLEERGKLERASSTIGRSVYRSALNFHEDWPRAAMIMKTSDTVQPISVKIQSLEKEGEMGHLATMTCVPDGLGAVNDRLWDIWPEDASGTVRTE